MRSPAKIEQGIKCCASTNVDKCTGCPYEGFSERTGCRTQLFKDTQDYLKAIRKSAARIEVMTKQLESAQPKWISIKERYPADDQCVMYVDDGEVAFRIVRGWALRELCEFPEHREVHRITHWMPLPEPPKEEA